MRLTVKAELTVTVNVPDWFTHDDVVSLVQQATAPYPVLESTGEVWWDDEATVVTGTEPPMAKG